MNICTPGLDCFAFNLANFIIWLHEKGLLEIFQIFLLIIIILLLIFTIKKSREE